MKQLQKEVESLKKDNEKLKVGRSVDRSVGRSVPHERRAAHLSLSDDDDDDDLPALYSATLP